MINEIIDLINGTLDGIHKEEIILGIAQSVHRTKSSGVVEFIPGIVELGSDEAIYAGVDDLNSLIVYHKVNAASLTYGRQANAGFGDGRRNEDIFSCFLFALWDTRKLKVYPADMVLLLRSRMPVKVIGVPGLNDVNVSMNNAILNTKQVFDSEYSLDENYLLPAYISMIQVNYTIQLKYDPDCASKCIDC